MNKKDTNLLGLWGEDLVAAYLQRQGYLLLFKRYRCRYGEIDLIATNSKFISFTEVKLRQDNSYGFGREAVDKRKQQRLVITAQDYLLNYPTNLQPRFDVAEILAPQGIQTKSPLISYIENAF